MKYDTLQYNVTFHGLKKWSAALFEKYGWMLIAKRDKYQYKISSYKQCIQHIINAIEERVKFTSCPERLLDLHIMLKNVKTLHSNAQKL